MMFFDVLNLSLCNIVLVDEYKALESCKCDDVFFQADSVLMLCNVVAGFFLES